MTLILPGNGRPPPPPPPAVRGEQRVTAPFGNVLGDRAAPPTQADVFNADGFFQGPTSAYPAEQSIVAVMPTVPPTSPEDRPSIAVDSMTTAPALAPAIARVPDGGMATLGPGLPYLVASTEAEPPPPKAAARVTPATAPATATSGATTRARAADHPAPGDPAIGAGRRLFARLLAQRGAALATRVAVTAVEHGVTVSIQVDRLDHEDRARLRDRVVALLSRHGLGAHEIQFAGDANDAPVSRAKEQ